VPVQRGERGSILDCCILGYRTTFESPFSPYEVESWVMWSDQDTFHYFFGTSNWLTALWRVPGGPLYVADNTQSIVRRLQSIADGEDLHAWEKLKIDLQPLGLFGLPDGSLYVWGRQGEKTALRLLDGKKFKSLPSPGAMFELSGTAPDRLWAAGEEGLLARWDGRKWTEISVETEFNFTGLTVVSDDEMWATTEGGELFEGSRDGWALRARNPRKGEALFDVARWKGSVWVAGGEGGVLRISGRGNKLEVVKPNIDATAFDARADLLAACPGFVGGTADGKSWTGVAEDSLMNRRKNDSPLWED
jgi:hypothetical protein